MIEIVKIDSGYKIVKDGVRIGFVSRQEDWTVRGTRIRWEARTTNKKYIGSYDTRKQAVGAIEYLNP